MAARMRLRRGDGQVYLNRWGFESKKYGGIFLHKMEAPDPGVDLHDHPWTFWSFILWGGYDEQRCLVTEAIWRARQAEKYDPKGLRGKRVRRDPFSWKALRRDECHRIDKLHRKTSWSLVIHGPNRNHHGWGFYEPDGFVLSSSYNTARRDMYEEIKNANT